MISPVIVTSEIVGMLNKMSGRIFSYQTDHSIHQSIYHNYKHTKQYPPNPRKTIGPAQLARGEIASLRMPSPTGMLLRYMQLCRVFQLGFHLVDVTLVRTRIFTFHFSSTLTKALGPERHRMLARMMGIGVWQKSDEKEEKEGEAATDEEITRMRSGSDERTSSPVSSAITDVAAMSHVATVGIANKLMAAPVN